MNQSEQNSKLDEWLGRHKGLLLKVVRSFAVASHDQDDLFQEIVFQIWKSIPNYKDEVAESTWIYRVALYNAISWSRKQTTLKRTKHELIEEPAIADARNIDPRVDWLYEKISKLDSVDRSLALLLLDGFSYREMSETLGMSESNVGVRISRIKSQLIKKLRLERKDEL